MVWYCMIREIFDNLWRLFLRFWCGISNFGDRRPKASVSSIELKVEQGLTDCTYSGFQRCLPEDYSQHVRHLFCDSRGYASMQLSESMRLGAKWVSIWVVTTSKLCEFTKDTYTDRFHSTNLLSGWW